MSHLEVLTALSISVSTEDAVSGTHGPATGNDIDLSTYLDTSRIQALKRLFDIPGQQGIDIFSRLLNCALTPPEDAPAEPRDLGSQYAALISVESLHVLSHLLKCSYETTTKYVTLFLTCGFLEKHKIKHSRRVYLAIPNGPYTPSPTLLADLDVLLARPASRPKVKALVRQVRDRSVTYGYSTSTAPGLEENVPGPLQHILTVLQSEEIDSTRHFDTYTVEKTLETDQGKQLTPITDVEASLNLRNKGESAPRAEAISIQLEQRHPRRSEARVIQFHNRRAEMVALPATLTLKEWKMTLEYFHYKCADFQINDYQVFEHVIPLTSSGGTTRYNCVPACVSCNSAKGDQHPRMLPPLSWIAGTLPRVQKYLKTRAEEMDS